MLHAGSQGSFELEVEAFLGRGFGGFKAAPNGSRASPWLGWGPGGKALRS